MDNNVDTLQPVIDSGLFQVQTLLTYLDNCSDIDYKLVYHITCELELILSGGRHIGRKADEQISCSGSA